LRNRHLKRLSFYEPDRPEAHINLAQDVRDPGVGIATTDIDDPLPKHRRIDERVPPEHVRYAWVRAKEGPNHLMRDERHLATTVARPRSMISNLEVGDVARDVKRHDLPSAARKELVAAGEPFENGAALRRAVLVTDDVRVCFKVPKDWRGAMAPLSASEMGAMLELSDPRMQVGVRTGKHQGAPAIKAGAPVTLSHRRLDQMADDASTMSPSSKPVANISSVCAC
jgi:hypothetical protein